MDELKYTLKDGHQITLKKLSETILNVNIKTKNGKLVDDVMMDIHMIAHIVLEDRRAYEGKTYS